MAKKKKKQTKSNHYPVIIAIILLVAAFISFIVFSNHDRYYECEVFLDGQNISNPVPNIDRLKNYDYYRIYLNEDNTFELHYRLQDSDYKKIEKGKYEFKNNNKKLILTYDNPTQEMDEICTYSVEGDYLVRNETVQFSIGDTIYYYIVSQKFEYK